MVVIVIIAVILVLAWPAFTNALTKRDLTRTMNNARELYLAAFRMATDGAAKTDASLAWPGDYPASSLAEYCGKLVEKDYVKAPELQRMLSAPRRGVRGHDEQFAAHGDVDRQERVEDL